MLSLQLFVVLLPALVLASEASWLDSLMSEDAENHADILHQLKRHLSNMEIRGYRGRGRGPKQGFVKLCLSYVCRALKTTANEADKDADAKKGRRGAKKGRAGPKIDFEKYSDLRDSLKLACEEFQDYLYEEKKARPTRRPTYKSRSRKFKTTTTTVSPAKRNNLNSYEKRELLNVLSLLQEAL